MANEKTATELRVNVGLGDKPVTNMLAYRLGPDMTAGTADDRAFATLAELDRITWVNSREFRLMLAWAKANGWVAEAPAPSDSCASAPTSRRATCSALRARRHGGRARRLRRRGRTRT